MKAKDNEKVRDMMFSMFFDYVQNLTKFGFITIESKHKLERIITDEWTNKKTDNIEVKG